jgi:hypothetical protein
MGIKQRDGPWRVLEHAIVDRKSGRETSLGSYDWADWDPRGDLLLARDGRMLRARFERGALQEPRARIDLSGEKFERVLAPTAAQRW